MCCVDKLCNLEIILLSTKTLTIPEMISPEVKRKAPSAGAIRAFFTDMTSDMFSCIHPAEQPKTPTKKAARKEPMDDEMCVGVMMSDIAEVSFAKYLAAMVDVAIPTGKNVPTATKDLRDSLPMPQMPWPEVQPEPMVVAKPTRRPATPWTR